MSKGAKSKSSSRAIKKPKKKSSRRTNATPQLPASNRSETTQLAVVQPQALQLVATPGFAASGLTRRDLAKMHADVVGDIAYTKIAGQLHLPPELLDAAGSGSISFQRSMRPKDSLERLALNQILLAHSRAAWLTDLLSRQKDMQSLAVVSEGCERAAGTFARLMRAFREHREPRNTGANVSIGQANLAQQQVVQTIQKQEAPRNENGGEQTRISQDTAAATPALPANNGRIALPAVGHSTNAAVDEKHGSKNRRRKGAGEDELIPSRLAVGRHHCAAKANDEDD